MSRPAGCVGGRTDLEASRRQDTRAGEEVDSLSVLWKPEAGVASSIDNVLSGQVVALGNLTSTGAGNCPVIVQSQPALTRPVAARSKGC
jgi:hypothetical protein